MTTRQKKVEKAPRAGRGSRIPALGLFCVLTLAFLIAPGRAYAGASLSLVTVEFPPFAFTDPGGRLVGANTETVRDALTRIGFEPAIDSLPSKRAQRMTAEGTYAALFPVTKSKSRDRYCIYSAPIAHIADVFFKRKSDAISWENLEDLDRYTVGATDGYNYAAVFLDAAADGHLKVDWITSSSPELQHLRKLAKGRIDLAICERSVCSHLLKKHRPELDSIDFVSRHIGPVRSFHVCFSRRHPDAGDLARDFDRAIIRMRGEGRVDEILDRYGVIDGGG